MTWNFRRSKGTRDRRENLLLLLLSSVSPPLMDLSHLLRCLKNIMMILWEFCTKNFITFCSFSKGKSCSRKLFKPENGRGKTHKFQCRLRKLSIFSLEYFHDFSAFASPSLIRFL